jgi:3D (Asp-Asp-Asp) domain-containing protein
MAGTQAASDQSYQLFSLEAEQTAQRGLHMKRFFFGLLMVILAVLAMAALTTPAHSQEPVVITDKLARPVDPAQCWEAPDILEDYENQKIEASLLAEANVIEDCTVTWYTASIEECGKDDGITYSGLPVVEGLTCAVDPDCIPLYSDVFVQYADGTVEQLWATDTGVKGNAIDIYTPDYDYAIQCGRQRLTVWWVEP